MSTTVVRKLNKEIRTLRQDITQIQKVLFKVLYIPEENINEYANSAHLRSSLKKALKLYPPR